MATTRMFEATADGERAFIEQRLSDFARAARSGFDRFGRGVVLVSVRPPHAPDKAGMIEYVSDASAGRVWAGQGWPDAITARAVGEYDPSVSFLVLVIDYERQTSRLHRFEGAGGAHTGA